MCNVVVIDFIACSVMPEWLLFRPLIVYVLACPMLVVVALLTLRDRRRREPRDKIESDTNGIHAHE